MRAALASCLLCAFTARAETVAVEVIESAGLGEAQASRVRKAAEVALRELSSFAVAEPKGRLSVRRGCAGDPSCLSAAARATGADHALLLWLRGGGGRLSVDGYFATGSGKAAHRRVEDASLDYPEVAAKSLVEALLPAYGRKGWGGLEVEAAAGAKVKLDGRAVGRTPLEPLAVTASVHSVDVLFPGGEAVLQRLSVGEGERLRLAVAPLSPLPEARAGGRHLRTAGLGLFGAGALAVAGSLLAGAASRRTAAELAPCEGADRSCLSYAEAQRKHEQASAYAQTGNILLGTGAALSVAGAGLFAFDLAGNE
ncbi:MAG: PEGA domain-containing protein [Myxococcales bacterium]|nr:PEGA domain-containing protein [Myxococcales bacterium]